MTSRNSFWDRSRENHKRRIWVWIVSVFVQLVAYIGFVTIYLTRIRRWNTEGAYRTTEAFKRAMCEATQDALGFSNYEGWIVIALAVIIGMQGFAYLYDRRKVDMYHSVPVSRKKRFAVIYVNGIIIYLTATLVSLFISVVLAAVQGAVNGAVLATAGLAFVWNLLYFLVMYHTMILAVMITGNRMITSGVCAVLIIYEEVLYSLINSYSYSFFDTMDGYFVSLQTKLSVLDDYEQMTWQLKRIGTASEIAKQALPYYAKWLVIAIVLLAVGYLAYSKRKSEAAGKAIAYGFLEPIIKIAIAIPGGMLIGNIVYNASYSDEKLLVIGMLAGTLILSAVLEVAYDFDIKALGRHLVSTGVAVAGALFVFFIFQADLFGYDRYLPDADSVESVAFSTEGFYNSYWDASHDYISQWEYEKANMFLTDVEPVLTLAQKSQQEDTELMGDARYAHILYRLKSGQEVGRSIWIDFDNPVTAALLDQIMGSDAWKIGTYQIMKDKELYDNPVSIVYTNGAVNMAVPTGDMEVLRDAWIKDMQQFDFSMGRNTRPCGIIQLSYSDYRSNELYVYENFTNTIAYLKSVDAYYPLALKAEDIESITITNYHNELNDYDESYDSAPVDVMTQEVEADYGSAVTEATFEDKAEIAQILQACYPNMLTENLSDPEEMSGNYDVAIVFKKDTNYPYDRTAYYFSYTMYADKVPAFVEEATAIDAQK